MKQMLQKILLLILGLGFVISSLGAAGLTAQAQEQILTLSTGTEPVIDPALGFDKYSVVLQANVFEGLTRTTTDGLGVEPAGAASWDISEDGLTYTFHLRENHWSDGVQVVAQDYEYGIKRSLTPETASPRVGEMAMIEGAEDYFLGSGSADDVKVTAVDEQTVEITLREATPHFLEIVGRIPAFYPVRQDVVEANPDWALEGGEGYVVNGPFIISEWAHNSHYVMLKNPNYWDADNVQLEQVDVQIIESLATANTMFLNGDLDYLGIPYHTVSAEMVDLYREQGNLQIADLAAFYNYAINTTDPQLSNVNIRKALAYAVNRESLIENVTKADQTAALRIVGPTATGMTQEAVYFEDQSYDEAREYLAAGLEELGLSDPSELTLTMQTNVSEEHSIIAQFLQETWNRELGIQVDINTTEWQLHLDDMRQGNFQLGRRGEGYEFMDMASFVQKFYSADNGLNHTYWESEEYQRLYDEAQQETDPARREELLMEAEAIFMEAMPIIPLYFYTNPYVVKENIVNMVSDPIGLVQLKHVYIE